MTDRIHRWFLERVFPKPDLVLFLDAPPRVLVARKSEVPVSYLEERRNDYLQRGRSVDRFETVDATQELEEVYQDVVSRVTELIAEGDGQGSVSAGSQERFNERDGGSQ